MTFGPGLPGDVKFASISAGQSSYTICLPHADTDYIQAKIAETGRPYEEQMLEVMAGALTSEDLVLDVGANIGNHTLFLAAVSGCRVVAYEPNAELVAGLRRSIDANRGLADRVRIREVGVASRAGRGSLTNLDPRNLGGQSVEVTPSGDFDVVTLDDEAFDTRVTAIKIDVEGMELEVLQGAARLINRDRPLIFVECGTLESFHVVTSLLEEHGYSLGGTFNATPTHLFRPASGSSEDREINAALVAATVRQYEATASQRALREALDSANLKYRAVTEANAALKDELAQVAAELTNTERRARNAESAFQRVRGEALRFRDERDGALKRAQRSERNALTAGAELVKTQRALRASKLALRKALKQLQAFRGRRAVRIADNAGDVLRALVRVTSAGLRRLSPPYGSQAPARVQAEATHTPANQPSPVSFTRTPLLRWSDASRLAPEHLAMRAERAETTRKRAQHLDVTGRLLRVAAIVDEFSHTGMAPECELRNLRMDAWREDLEGFEPDILFVESAWRGADGTWHNTVPRVPAELRDLLAWCAERAVPTVFWNKEDPVHFETFLPAASEFDFVFTTDIDMVPLYRRELGHDRVGFLPFASQPRHHHPIETSERKNAMVFAGGYYRRYPERMRDLDAAIEGAAGVLPVEIYDRNLGTTLEDYAFPASYEKYIVGTLAADEIDLAYKGYNVALNLNSVKSSSSMFARRAVELLMSGTPTVSNYAHGLRTMFGDLVPMSDGAEGMRTNLRALAGDVDYRDKLRTVALRKVLREHTYAERLRLVMATVRGEDYQPVVPIIGALAKVDDEAAYRRVVTAVAAQEDVAVRLVVITDDPDVAAISAAEGHAAMDVADAKTSLASAVLPGLPLAVLDPSDWYGPHYLSSLGQAQVYATAEWITKEERFSVGDQGPDRIAVGDAHRRLVPSAIEPRRSLASQEALAELTVAELLASEIRPPRAAEVVSVDPFDYCEDGAGVADVSRAAGSELPVDVGASLPQMLASLPPAEGPPSEHDVLVVDSAVFPRTPPAGSDLRIVRQGFSSIHLSRFTDPGPVNLWLPNRLSVLEHLPDGQARFRLETTGTLRLNVIIRWWNAAGTPIGSVTRAANLNHTVDVPTEAHSFQFGVRVANSGTGVIRNICLGHREAAPRIQPRGAKTLVLADAYPSYDNLYRYAFVHSRVREYRRRGFGVDMFRFQRADGHTYYEYEGVEVESGNAEALRAALSSGHYERVLVHFLSEEIWDVLKDYADDLWITVWVHGAEVQPWWRRSYATPEEEAQAKPATVARLAFWRNLLDHLPERTGFVFVSEYFLWEVTTDLEREFPKGQVRVIHNPIDTSLFDYVQKSEDDRLRILSIRPYASPKYGNDLSVAAVLELSTEPWFGELEFLFVGDGVLFERTVAPLRGMKNVRIQRGYLNHQQISTIHKGHGVFLVPTRVDAQGVSRDEAMSSGLVPVTSAVTAIPEFVSDVEGYLAPGEDAHGLADAIRDMYANPDVFIRKSAASAARVRRQTSSDIVIPQEIEFASRDLRAPDLSGGSAPAAR